jgi:ADP-ribose pyrophosphatase YjhB (NUDIX family)
MATPEFILALREKIGTMPLWLCGVTAVVARDDEVLLVRRADTGEWSPVCGIVDPGEEPSDAAVREVLEEADVHASVEHLAWVHVTDMLTYDNGDRTQYVDIVFRLQWRAGTPYPADGENTDAQWFARGELPEMSTDMHQRVETALGDQVAARFGPLTD